MNGIIVHNILLVFIVFPTLISSKMSSCPASYCGTDNLPIKYPFRLESDLQTPKSCQDHISLKCNDQGQTMINLPSYGDFNVSFIDYRQKMIALTDPGNCMPKRLMNKSSLYPLKPFVYEYYTYYTCPRKLVRSLLSEIRCLSDSINETVATSQRTQEYMKATYGCEPIVRTQIPISSGNYYPLAISNDLELTWDALDCNDCEDYGVEGPGGSRSKWAALFASPAFITFATMFTTFSGIALILRLIKIAAAWRNANNASDNNNLAITSDASRQLSDELNTVTAQESAIEGTPISPAQRQPERKAKGHTKLIVLSESEASSSLCSEATCSICLEEYHVKDTIRYLAQCGHYFHAQCVDQWLQKNVTCPVCRNDLFRV